MKTINRKLWRGTVFLVTLACGNLFLVIVCPSWPTPAASERTEPPSDMRLIGGGVYAPLFKTEAEEQATTVAPFYLDMYPVTHAQYRDFVQANQRWRRSQVSPLLADAAYLYHWQTDFPRPEVAAAKVQVLAMVYTTCESACPLIVSLMQRIEAALPPELRPDVGFVLVTFDPARDTPAVLSAYGTRMGLDPGSWLLLSGHPDDVLELATLLGIKYKRNQSGGFLHSNVITVLNKAGEMVHRHEGLQQDILSTLAVIRRAAQD